MTPNKGMSTCPICRKTWLVTPREDCLLPACGCYGNDTEATNQSRPCENCGMAHAFSCRRPRAANDDAPVIP